ncbi:MAG: ABC transporter ATP-binding protein [Candidatus Kryptoniota bacterium]
MIEEKMKSISLSVSHLTKRFGNSVLAVNDFNIDIEDGDFVSLLGPSGCGKTTVLRCIAGFERPDSGDIKFYGKTINNLPPEKRNLGMVFQSYALFPNMTVGENVAFPMRLQGKSKVEQRKRALELLELIQLEDYFDRYPRQLSGGQQQRVALARALAKNPKVLLLDEPLSALDAKIREELRVEIRRIQNTLGITTLYVTHDQEEALSMSDKVVVMNKGIIQQIGTPPEVYDRPINKFVANFIGVMNLIPGKLVETGKFEFKDLLIHCMHENTFPLHKEALLAVRPGVIRIAQNVQEIPQGQNQIPAVVDLITFLGSIARISARTPQGLMLRIDVDVSSLNTLQKGSPIIAYFSPQAGLLIAEDE